MAPTSPTYWDWPDSQTRVVRDGFVAFSIPMTSGLLLGCCFFGPPAHWLAWISLVPVANSIARRGQTIATYSGMYCAGLIFNLITTDWIRTLNGGIGLSGADAPDWLLQSQLLALFWPLTLGLGRTLVAAWPVPMSLALPVVWIIHELLLRSVWSLVDGTGWQAYFVGCALVDHRYISQIADLGGESALTVIAASVNGTLWDCYSRCWKRGGHRPCMRRALASGGVTVSLLVCSYCYGAWVVDQTVLTRGPIVWLLPQESLRDRFAEVPWKADGRRAPDVLLSSELAFLGSPIDSSRSECAMMSHKVASFNVLTVPQIGTRENSPETAMEALCRQCGIPLVIGYTRAEEFQAVKRRYNSAAFVDPRDGFQGHYDKVGLVPWSEFAPWQGLTSRRGAEFSRGMTFPVFKLRSSGTHKSYRFACAICFDVAFTGLFRRYMHATGGAPEFFLVCSSEGSDKTGQLSRQALNMARLRAIECRRTLVRNVHHGHSGTIDSTGRLRDEDIPLLLGCPTALNEIPIDHRMTVYALWGDWITPAVVGVVVIAAGMRIHRRGH